MIMQEDVGVRPHRKRRDASPCTSLVVFWTMGSLGSGEEGRGRGKRV